MPDESLVLSRLDGVRKVGDNWQARCPAHDDKHQSLSVKFTDGRLLLYCHAGCQFADIIKILDLPPESGNDNPVIAATYDYTDGEGKLLYQVVRYQPKAFKHRRPDGHGGWVWDLAGIKPTLYHLPEVIQAIKEKRLIWIVEGEKDADNLRKAGQTATSISGGAAAKWPPNIVPMFLDSRVAIIPDNDEPGRKYAEYVANLLYGWCASIKIIELPSKDVSDFLLSSPIDKLMALLDTRDYVPHGVVTRDEFEAWRGVNQYLYRMLLRQRAKYKQRYNDYEL